MVNKLKEYIENLQEYKKILDLHNAKEFDALISAIIKEVPEPYSSKVKALSFYEVYDDDESDLPF